MSKWIVNTYTFSPIQGGYFVTQGNLNYTLISGNLTLNAGDTSKVTFVVPKSVADDLYPVRTLVEVKFGNGLNPERKFFGTVVKKTRVIPDGTYKFEAVGVLGSYQFLPNYDRYGNDATILGIISTESQRFTGQYQPGSQYYTPNPWEALYNGHNEIPSSFGQLSMNNINLRLTCNLDSLQKKSKNAYEFLKAITKESSFILPEDYVNPPYTFRWFENGETAQFKMIAGDNDQSITYDTNLISCSLAEEPYYTRVMTYSNGNGTYNFSDQSANGYPCPFNYARIPLPNKTDGSAYTYTEVQNATREELKKYPQLIEATAFDRHIIDESVPWLDMSKRVYVFYAPDEYVKAEITQIVYDFADPTKDRVKLGKIVQTATDSISTVSEQIENTVKEYLPLAGGKMEGDITYDNTENNTRNQYEISGDEIHYKQTDESSSSSARVIESSVDIVPLGWVPDFSQSTPINNQPYVAVSRKYGTSASTASRTTSTLNGIGLSARAFDANGNGTAATVFNPGFGSFSRTNHSLQLYPEKIVQDSNRYALTCNLLDSALIEQGATNGLNYVTTDARRITSARVKVSAGTTYYIQSVAGGGVYIETITFFNSSGTTISDKTDMNALSGSFTTPANCAWVRIQWYNLSGNLTPSDVTSVQLEKGSNSTSVVPFSLDAEQVAERLQEKEWYTSGLITTSTTLADTGVSLRLGKKGFYIIHAQGVANRSGVSQIALTYQYGQDTSRSQLARQDSLVPSSRLTATFCGYIDLDNADIRVWAKYSSSAQNTIAIYAKRLYTEI